MKPWAEQFYNSKQWHECRAALLASKHYLCDRCDGVAEIVHHKKYLTAKNINDPSISLAWDNLEALCRTCHNRVHHGIEAIPRYSFDSAGNIIPPYRRNGPRPYNTECEV